MSYAATTTQWMDSPEAEPVPVAARPPADRGDLTIAPVVVEKIAERAALGVQDVAAVVRSGLGRLLNAGTAAAADVDQQATCIDLTLAVRYPAPVAVVAEQVRQQVSDQVASFTGLSVQRVDISVAELTPDDERRPGRRVE